MSFKTELQSNNTDLQAILETINELPEAEDVTTEVNAYTEKLTQLDTALTALEAELEGKASGGNVNTCTVKLVADGGANASRRFSSVVYTCLENGKMVGRYPVIPSSLVSECVLNNVVCDTVIAVATDYDVHIGSVTCSNGGLPIIHFSRNIYIQAPSDAGVETVVNIQYYDP